MPTVRIFLCSTYSDLVAERDAVLAALDRMRLSHQAMEHFGARSQQPIEACLEEVARANIVIVVVGHRYGSLVPSRQVSFTEAEYREAQRLRKVILVYLRHEDQPISPKHVEQDPKKIELFNAFRSRLQEERVVATFREPGDLAKAVEESISANLSVVERSAAALAEGEAALIEEITSIAREAIDAGVGQSALLSAIRTATHNLANPPTRPILELWRASVRLLAGNLAKSFRAKQPLVFLSYARQDTVLVLDVAHRLQNHKLAVWVDQQEIQLGDTLVEGLRRGLSRADAFVFFCSEASLRSHWVKQELEYFASKRVSGGDGPRIIPLVLDGSRLPAYLQDLVYIDLRDGNSSRAAAMIAAAVHREPYGDYLAKLRRGEA